MRSTSDNLRTSIEAMTYANGPILFRGLMECTRATEREIRVAALISFQDDNKRTFRACSMILRCKD